MCDEPKVGREPWWSELSTEQRVDRMRKVIKQLDSHLDALADKVFRLGLHEHNPHNGHPVVPLDLESSAYIPPPVGDPDDTYF